MRKILFWILVFFLLASAASAQVERNAMCPVMQGKHTKEKFNVDYQGRRIYFCCRSCVRAFQKNPGKFLPRLQAQAE